ncbi:hypothetical protein EYF80_046320 [Liparis tanakae]|uniref:Uncharacterized protein n=1 Tax=Liparis tanakae TaxID=230148 RepID=A0A4Z2FQT0_9TELE|nr:hypothetical protein EYF80_046320 [Liparis tanakae]
MQAGAEGLKSSHGSVLSPYDVMCHASVTRENSPRFLTINADHAITIDVSGLQEGGGLSVGQSSGGGGEVLQEKPEERKSREEPLSARRPGGQK